MPQYNFDATKVEPDKGRIGAIPKGWYSAIIKKTTVEETEKGGHYFNFMFEVIEGQYKGATVFHMFQFDNSNQKTVEIAHKQLSQVSHCVKVLQWSQTEQLHNIPLKIRLKVEEPPEGSNYEAKNEITAFTDYNDPKAVNVAAAPSAPKPATAPPAPAWAPPPQSTTIPPVTAPAPVAAPAPAWQPPAAPQPWEQPTTAAPAAPPQQTTAAPPQWNPAPNVAPPVSNVAPNTGVPDQQQTIAPLQAPQAAPSAPPQGQVPPWIQQQQ